jgi:hypothetical protein
MPGLYENINRKRKRIKSGSGEKMRSPGDPGAPSDKAFEESAKTAKKGYRNGGCVMGNRGVRDTKKV